MLKINKGSCSGCGVCAAVCPVGCIEMVEDSEGFVYPLIDKQRCKSCKVCDKMCPFANAEKLVNKEGKNCFAVQIKDKDLLKE